MKTTFVFIIALVTTFYSCENNEVKTVGSSITNDGILSGVIVNTSNSVDSIKIFADSIVTQFGYQVVSFGKMIGKSTVSSDGKFSVALETPLLSKIKAYPIGVNVSDTTAMTGSVHYFNIFAYKGGECTGKIYDSNEPSYTYLSRGWSVSLYMYSDRPYTMIGTEEHTYWQRVGYYLTIKTNYNLTFIKGWNEFVLKEGSYSETASTSLQVETYSNRVTSDLHWRYFPN